MAALATEARVARSLSSCIVTQCSPADAGQGNGVRSAAVLQCSSAVSMLSPCCGRLQVLLQLLLYLPQPPGHSHKELPWLLL
jgi:hypothetical protein